MEMFSYVMVLASVIAGLAITQLLQCIAGMVQNPRESRPYWVHLVWIVYAFEYVALWWWYEWNFAKTAEWSFALYLFILVYAVVIYLMCAVLAPLGPKNFGAYYYSRRRWFLALAALASCSTSSTLCRKASRISSSWARITRSARSDSRSST